MTTTETTAEYDAAVGLLRKVGRRRARAVSTLERVEVELRDAIRAAAAAGVPKRAIGREAGVVRQTVYNVLERD